MSKEIFTPKKKILSKDYEDVRCVGAKTCEDGYEEPKYIRPVDREVKSSQLDHVSGLCCTDKRLAEDVLDTSSSILHLRTGLNLNFENQSIAEEMNNLSSSVRREEQVESDSYITDSHIVLVEQCSHTKKSSYCNKVPPKTLKISETVKTPVVSSNEDHDIQHNRSENMLLGKVFPTDTCSGEYLSLRNCKKDNDTINSDSVIDACAQSVLKLRQSGDEIQSENVLKRNLTDAATSTEFCQKKGTFGLPETYSVKQKTVCNEKTKNQPSSGSSVKQKDKMHIDSKISNLTEVSEARLSFSINPTISRPDGTSEEQDPDVLADTHPEDSATHHAMSVIIEETVSYMLASLLIVQKTKPQLNHNKKNKKHESIFAKRMQRELSELYTKQTSVSLNSLDVSLYVYAVGYTEDDEGVESYVMRILRNQNVRDVMLEDESFRLATFFLIPDIPVGILSLASKGFYCDENRRIKCCVCSLVYTPWQEDTHFCLHLETCACLYSSGTYGRSIQDVYGSSAPRAILHNDFTEQMIDLRYVREVSLRARRMQMVTQEHDARNNSDHRQQCRNGEIRVTTPNINIPVRTSSVSSGPLTDLNNIPGTSYQSNGYGTTQAAVAYSGSTNAMNEYFVQNEAQYRGSTTITISRESYNPENAQRQAISREPGRPDNVVQPRTSMASNTRGERLEPEPPDHSEGGHRPMLYIAEDLLEQNATSSGEGVEGSTSVNNQSQDQDVAALPDPFETSDAFEEMIRAFSALTPRDLRQSSENTETSQESAEGTSEDTGSRRAETRAGSPIEGPEDTKEERRKYM